MKFIEIPSTWKYATLAVQFPPSQKGWYRTCLPRWLWCDVVSGDVRSQKDKSYGPISGIFQGCSVGETWWFEQTIDNYDACSMFDANNSLRWFSTNRMQLWKMELSSGIPEVILMPSLWRCMDKCREKGKWDISTNYRWFIVDHDLYTSPSLDDQHTLVSTRCIGAYDTVLRCEPGPFLEIEQDLVSR